jgi:MFS family permease
MISPGNETMHVMSRKEMRNRETAYTTSQRTTPSRRWLALAVLGIVQFMIVIDNTIVNVALPSIQRDLHFSSSDLAWVVDGYLLTAGGLLLLGGRLGDLFGQRRPCARRIAAFAIPGEGGTSTGREAED